MAFTVDVEFQGGSRNHLFEHQLINFFKSGSVIETIRTNGRADSDRSAMRQGLSFLCGAAIGRMLLNQRHASANLKLTRCPWLIVELDLIPGSVWLLQAPGSSFQRYDQSSGRRVSHRANHRMANSCCARKAVQLEDASRF